MSNRAPTRPRLTNPFSLFECNTAINEHARRPTTRSKIQKNRARSIVRSIDDDIPKAPLMSATLPTSGRPRNRSNGIYRPRNETTTNEISRPLPSNRSLSSKPRTALEQILRQPVLRDGLLQFAKKEFSDESVLLLIELQEYKLSTGIEKRTKKAYEIYYKYIIRNAEREVNLDAFMCEELKFRLDGCDKNCCVRYTGIDIFKDIEVVISHTVADIFLRYTAATKFS